MSSCSMAITAVRAEDDVMVESRPLAYRATHEDVVNDRDVFFYTFHTLHDALGTRINIPVIGGKLLDLHQLYIEVTKRGGFEKVVKDKKWREVGTVFKLPPTTTSASYVLKKNYRLLLKDFEKIYFNMRRSSVPPQPSPVASAPPPPAVEALPAPEAPLALEGQESVSIPMLTGEEEENGVASALPPTALLAPPALEGQESVSIPMLTGQEQENEGDNSRTVLVKLFGKCEDCYFALVKRGLRIQYAVLYHPANLNSLYQAPVENVPYNNPVLHHNPSPANCPDVLSDGKRRKRTRRQRDPDHPRSNRSAYNFFFSAKHTEFKSSSSAKGRNFTKMIGEAWNNLSDEERKVYQDLGRKDKERYQKELQDYNKRKALPKE